MMLVEGGSGADQVVMGCLSGELGYDDAGGERGGKEGNVCGHGLVYMPEDTRVLSCSLKAARRPASRSFLAEFDTRPIQLCIGHPSPAYLPPPRALPAATRVVDLK
jgi:hypothetical protein